MTTGGQIPIEKHYRSLGHLNGFLLSKMTPKPQLDHFHIFKYEASMAKGSAQKDNWITLDHVNTSAELC